MVAQAVVSAADIRAALSCGKRGCECSRQSGSLTHCPAHGTDKHPSLSVQQGHTAAVFRCHTGCSRDDVIAALRERGLMGQASSVTRSQFEPEAVYRYISEHGEIVGEKGRFSWWKDGERHKTFRWRLPGSEQWGGLGGLTMPLYNLPSVLSRPTEPVWFVEGELAATALIDRGMLAVTNYGGAGQKEWGDSLSWLLGRDVILWPDNDDAGYGLMGVLLRRLPGARLIAPELPEKADAFDYFEAGGTLEALASLAEVTVRRGSAPTGPLPLYRRPDCQGEFKRAVRI